MYVSKPPINSILSPDKVEPSVDLTDLGNTNTTTAKSVEGHSACTYYNVLDSVNRNVATLNNESVCLSEGHAGHPCCDQNTSTHPGKKTPDWKGQGWYRCPFLGNQNRGPSGHDWVCFSHPCFSADWSSLTKTDVG